MGLFDIFHRSRSILDAGILEGRTDRHSHILFGGDDGIRTLDKSLAVLSYMEDAGVVELWCTPHIMEDVPNTTAALQERFEQLKAAYTGNITLHLAAEYMLDPLFEKRLSERDLLTMEDNMLLVETSTWTPPVNFYDLLENTMKAGYRPILAHPERYRYLKEAGYRKLKDMGVKFQMNLPSIVGFYGETANRKAVWLLENGFYDEFGSDCHRFATTKEQFERKVLTSDVLHLFSK